MPTHRIGQVIWSPAMIADYVRSADRIWEATNADYHAARAAGGVPDRLWRNWSEALAGWRAFVQDMGDSWTGGTVDRVNAYLSELKDWQSRLRAQGGRVQAPRPRATDSQTTEAALGFGRDFAWALGSAAAIALIFALVKKGWKG